MVPHPWKVLLSSCYIHVIILTVPRISLTAIFAETGFSSDWGFLFLIVWSFVWNLYNNVISNVFQISKPKDAEPWTKTWTYPKKDSGNGNDKGPPGSGPSNAALAQTFHGIGAIFESMN